MTSSRNFAAKQHCVAVCRECLSDIKRILDCFDERGHCRKSLAARQAMKDLKAKWKELDKQYEDTELGTVIHQALVFLDVRSDSVPDGRWVHELYGAEVGFDSCIASCSKDEGSGETKSA